jgi:lipopolysaccharide transport system permease protein
MQNESSYYLVIDPTQADRHYLKDLWRYRELFVFLAWRDILVRYKQAVFGILWALFRPLLSMLVFATLFGKIANLPSGNISYPLFVLAGILPWIFFSTSAIDTGNGLVNNTPLIGKIYFPRLIIPTSQIIINLVDFAVAGLLLLVVAGFMKILDPWTLISLPLWILLMISLSTGLGFWLSALTVKFRDFRIIVPFLVQFGMFVSPVGYASFIIPEQWQWLYCLNPLVGIINGFRWAFFGISDPTMTLSVIYSILLTTGILISGFYYFRKMERTFADMI